MKNNQGNLFASLLRPLLAALVLPTVLCVGLCSLGAGSVTAAEFQVVPTKMSGAVTNLTPVHRASRWTQMNLSIGLPLRDQAGLTNLLQQLYDPQSPEYRHFLTPDQFAERFGPSEADYEAVVKFARTHGLIVTEKHSNRTLVSVRGTVAEVERAFHVTINEYQHPTEKRTFFAPNVAPSLDLSVPVLTIGGLDNYFLPRPCIKPMNGPRPKVPLTGSAPDGSYLGSDFRHAYVPGITLTGTGQSVALFELDSGFYQKDITAYESLAGLPNVPVSAILLDGYNGGPGFGNDEVSLDIEMAVSMAPGLKSVLVYEGDLPDDILNRMATDDSARQIGASWTYSIDASTEQIFLQFAAQGQSYFNASGDGDAYTGDIDTPADDVNITIVGGTTLSTVGPGGAWSSETVWNRDNGTGTGGGISTRNAIPVWQQGVNMSLNQGSTTMRNIPDVALTAENVYVIYGNGLSEPVGGTSCATPLWAGFIALVNELALTNGEPAMGFLNPAIYAIGKGSNSFSYPSSFHDVTTGNNESPSSPNRFVATRGYDLCTGWGTPVGSNLITALALPEPLRIAPNQDLVFSGPVGGPFVPTTQSYVLTNNGGHALNWSLINTSAWFNIAPTNGSLTRGGPATAVSITPAAATLAFPAGSYDATLLFTNQTDKFVQHRNLILAVVTPPVITAQPTNQSLLQGMTATFTVGIGTNALMVYQWQKNGANLVDGGQVSGSTTSSLTIGDVSPANAGVYSVNLSNAAGQLVSSNATLTIVSSAPVIIDQPTNQTILPGAAASFSVTAVGNRPYSYQWQLNGTKISEGGVYSGTTTSNLVISAAFDANAGIYSVLVRNSLGTIASTGAVLALIPVTSPGVTMTTIQAFTDPTAGQNPYCSLVQGKDGTFFGTTIVGGDNLDGTLFKMSTNGTLTTLHSFDLDDGGLPYCGLCLGADGNYYGTTYLGGTYIDGNTFRLAPKGTFTALTSFNGQNGQSPVGGLALAHGGLLYGTTLEGGDYTYGTIFRMTSAGTVTSLVSFNGLDGSYPSPTLVQAADGTLYGTTENGGAYDAGTIFAMSPAGNLTTLYSFSGQNDGAVPIAGLVQGVDGNLYGTTYSGGSAAFGTLFKISPTGAFTVLYTFTGGDDGGTPWGGLIQATDGNLYGTTQSGGTYGFGTVFQLSPSGNFTTLAQFEDFNGANPSASLLQGLDGSLYGTTETGGALENGTVFRLFLTGPLQITGQPTDQPTYVGGTAVFSVATSGGGPVSYQWQKNGVALSDGGNVSGSASGILTITNVALADAAVYTVTVSNAFNSLTSEGAVLQVIFSPPSIISQPVSETRVAGMSASFSVTAVGDQPLSYQWQENGTNLIAGGNVSGVNGSILSFGAVSAANSGAISVVISNSFYTVSSAPVLLTVIPATSPSAAQNVLHPLNGTTDGAFLYAGLVQGKDGFLYGAAEAGGSLFYGTIFRITTAGSFYNLYNFSDGDEGANPFGGLVQAANGPFYGPASAGGTFGSGSIYKFVFGSAAQPFYSFQDGDDGGDPENSLIQGTDGNFYGASVGGGTSSAGSIYKLNADGVVTPLYDFTGDVDGAFPLTDLVQGRDGKLYGTTVEGGENGFGTVFSLTTTGAKFTTLYSFSYTDGAYPEAGVVQGPDGNFYGTTFEGGTNGSGTVFCLSTNGALTTLYSFNGTNGAGPAGNLVLGSDGNFYGTTSSGGTGGQGTAFKISTNGALANLIWFDGLNGASPESALIQAGDGNFYGTTAFGGTGFNPSAGGGNGVIFRLSVPVFTNSLLTVQSGIACLPYAGTLAGKAVTPTNDTLSYAKISGPDWLIVQTNGALAGTPTNSDIGTNIFIVGLTDAHGVSAAATVKILINPDPAPTFLANPITKPRANLDENYAGSIATNATAPYLANGDQLTFAKLSGPPWLMVAPNGGLTGTPTGPDAGSNSFIVSVTDLGGSSNIASLFLYVNSPPAFVPPSFSDLGATVGLLYVGTIATNAFDSDLPAGDALSFYKVTGPAWLTVATNGVLSGTPTSSDPGYNSFLLLVIDSGGLAGVGSLGLPVAVDQPPVFNLNPLSEPSAIAGQPYAATIATAATDPDRGDHLTFSKVSGPAWLIIGADGGLSGLPLSTNAGANSFTVRAMDTGGLSASVSLVINVTAVPIVTTISEQGGSLMLGWSGGVPPYQIQSATSLSNPNWQNLGTATGTTNLMITPTNGGMFYRIQGQ